MGQWWSFLSRVSFSDHCTALNRAYPTSLTPFAPLDHVSTYSEQRHSEDLTMRSEQAGITWQKSLVRHHIETWLPYTVTMIQHLFINSTMMLIKA